jgi:multidrug efflux pump subunit AcrA (membrane-fusion protein)
MPKRFFLTMTGVLLVGSLLYSSCSTQQSGPAQGPAQSAQSRPPRPDRERYDRLLPRQAPVNDIIFVGKAFCSLRRALPLRFPAIVTSLEVKSGDAVKKGQPLGRFRLTPEAYRRLRDRVWGATAGPDAQSLATDLGLLNEELGVRVSADSVPREGVIASPLDGRVLWVDPDFRPGVQLEASPAVFKVGVMDPMVIRANVYEAEARRLKIGDEVTIRPETMPDWQVRARVSEVALTPVSQNPIDPSYYEVECTVANSDLVLREGMRILVYLFKPSEGK